MNNLVGDVAGRRAGKERHQGSDLLRTAHTSKGHVLVYAGHLIVLVKADKAWGYAVHRYLERCQLDG